MTQTYTSYNETRTEGERKGHQHRLWIRHTSCSKNHLITVRASYSQSALSWKNVDLCHIWQDCRISDIHSHILQHWKILHINTKKGSLKKAKITIFSSTKCRWLPLRQFERKELFSSCKTMVWFCLNQTSRNYKRADLVKISFYLVVLCNFLGKADQNVFPPTRGNKLQTLLPANLHCGY